ncbi:MAG: tetratricopeptide repeat protein, partial [Planctomycetota bacterium]
MSNIHVPSRTGREFLAPAILLIAAICSGRPATAFAQGGDSTPSQIYGAAFEPFYEGEYKDALETFVNEARGGIKTAQSRWIDSICYETMVAECHYHMGSLDEALKHYNAALQLFVAYSDWMLRVQFQPIRPMNAKAVPWGTSSRRSRLGFYPTSYSISQGRVDNMQQYKHGGVVQPATLFPINVVEIVRCTALAIRRRAAILGPVAPYDELTNSVVAALTRGVAPPNHWSEAWAQVNLGLALVAAGKEPQGISALKQSLMAAGEFDHPLTCVALLELGKLALQNGDYPAAATYFEEASYSAFHYSDLDVIEESLRLGALTHLLANRQGMYPPLAIVAQWAKTKQYRVLQASMLLCAAENALLMNRTADAGKLLDECRNAIGRRTMASGRIGARASYVGAAALFQQRRVSDGDAELANAMAYMRRGSIWLYQISMVDTLWVTKALKTNRIANDLYSVVLRDPQIRDWHLDPMEALAVLGTPHAVAFEHWFEVALERKEHEAAIEIADRTRRHRFFSTLPFGGRLDSLRWLLEGPKEYLDMQAQLSRQDLLTRYAEYAKLQTQVVQLRKALAASPLVAPDQSALKQQQQIYAQVAALSMQQEAVLREMAVRREAAPMVFPPLKSLGEVQKSLPKGSAMLVFFATSKQLHGFLLNNERYTYWTVASVAGLTRQMQALFRELGMHQANYELKAEELDQSKWQPAAASAFELLMRGSRADLTQGVEELIVVPDGLVWYLPFELMAAKFDGVEQPLIMRLR